MTNTDTHSWRDISDQLMSEQRHFYGQLPDEHPTEKAAEWARKHWLQRARRDANANTIRRVMNIAPRPDMRAGSEATRVDDEFSMFIEGTRREVFDVEMVWIDASDDSPSGFSACDLGGVRCEHCRSAER